MSPYTNFWSTFESKTITTEGIEVMGNEPGTGLTEKILIKETVMLRFSADKANRDYYKTLQHRLNYGDKTLIDELKTLITIPHKDKA